MTEYKTIPPGQATDSGQAKLYSLMARADRLTIDPLKYQGTSIYEYVSSLEKPGLYDTTETLALKLPKRFKGIEHYRSRVAISNGVLYIAKGFIFDGASGPAIDGITNMLAALIHDALYALLRSGALGFSLISNRARNLGRRRNCGFFGQGARKTQGYRALHGRSGPGLGLGGCFRRSMTTQEANDER